MQIARPIYGPRGEEPSPLRPVPDLAGTPVVDVKGRFAGTVYGALADARSGLIRYLDVALEGSDRHVLVPLGHTRVNDLAGEAEIELRAATREDLDRIPPYQPKDEGPDGDFQRSILAAHGRLFRGERYYAHPAYDHRGLYAGEHPIVRGRPAPLSEGPLQPLSDLADYRVAEGEPDIRGWPLDDAAGERIGVLDDLLVDPGAEKVRYALARLDSEDREATPIPVGLLQIDGDDEVVRTPTLEREDLEAIPAYHAGEFGREEEEEILETIESRLDGERHFDRPDFMGDGDLAAR